MAKAKHHLWLTSVLISLALVSMVSCVIAELNKTDINDIKLDGDLCYLPSSHSFGLGIAALACLCIAHIIVISTNFCTRDHDKKKNITRSRPNLALILLLVSWGSSAIAVVLLGTATSMNRQQEYGKGWLDGECYVVKQGVYIASGIIIMLSVASLLASSLLKIIKPQIQAAEEDACIKT